MRFLVCTILGFAGVAALIGTVVILIRDLPGIIEMTNHEGFCIEMVVLWAHLICGPLGFALLAHLCVFEGSRPVSKEQARAFDTAFAVILCVALVGLRLTMDHRYPSGETGVWFRVGLWLCVGFLAMWVWRRLWPVGPSASRDANP